MNKEGERGETQIKTEVYHSLLDEIYDIPPHHPITKIDNTENQAQPEEKETQHGEIYTAWKPEIIPSLIRPLPHPYLLPKPNPPKIHLHQLETTHEPNTIQTNISQRLVTPSNENTYPPTPPLYK